MWLGLWDRSGRFPVSLPDGELVGAICGLFAYLSESARRSACDIGEAMGVGDISTEELVAELRRRGFDFLKAGYMIEVEKLAENRTRADLAPCPGS